uniref:Pre-mRNA-splicing factor 18 n=1 Tax=Alexandrium andersonii TaxID=327968 RepID=A0A7S2DRM6_9DINO
MDSKMMEAIAAHQAAQKAQKEADAQKKKRKKGAADGFHTFQCFDARSSQAVAHGKKARQEAEDSDSQPEEPEERKKEEIKVDWSTPPEELLPRAEVSGGESPALYVAHFVRFVMGKWSRCLAENGKLQVEGLGALSDPMRAVYESEASLRETQEMLAPLIRELEHSKVDDEIMKHLGKMVGFAVDREYKEAMTSYVEITIGRKKWNNAVMFGEAKHNKGFNARRVKRDEDNKFDSDETVKKYIQAIRRIFNFAQLIRPNEDVSKHM